MTSSGHQQAQNFKITSHSVAFWRFPFEGLAAISLIFVMRRHTLSANPPISCTSGGRTMNSEPLTRTCEKKWCHEIGSRIPCSKKVLMLAAADRVWRWGEVVNFGGMTQCLWVFLLEEWINSTSTATFSWPFYINIQSQKKQTIHQHNSISRKSWDYPIFEHSKRKKSLSANTAKWVPSYHVSSPSSKPSAQSSWPSLTASVLSSKLSLAESSAFSTSSSPAWHAVVEAVDEEEEQQAMSSHITLTSRIKLASARHQSQYSALRFWMLTVWRK